MAGHAGNTPMRLRRDALAGAAELVLEVERLARETDGLTATVGRIHNEPNVGNVIAGQDAELSYDVRHQDDGDARPRARPARGGRARDRRTARAWSSTGAGATTCARCRCRRALRARLARACERAGVRAFELGSGAGHDAVTAVAADARGRRCCSCAARTGSATTRPSRSRRGRALDVVTALERGMGNPDGSQHHGHA